MVRSGFIVFDHTWSPSLFFRHNNIVPKLRRSAAICKLPTLKARRHIKPRDKCAQFISLWRCEIAAKNVSRIRQGHGDVSTLFWGTLTWFRKSRVFCSCPTTYHNLCEEQEQNFRSMKVTSHCVIHLIITVTWFKTVSGLSGQHTRRTKR